MPQSIIRQRLKEAEDREPGEPGPDDFGPADHQEPIDFSKVRFTKGGIPPGAKRLHLYPIQHVLKPRGPMEKESLSLEIAEKLRGAFESWTDPKYGDSISAEKMTSVLKQNLDAEVAAAWQAFLDGN